MTEDLDRLDVLAAAAMVAVGHWHNAGFLRAFIDGDDDDVFSPEDAAFIAACDPATIRSLVAAVRERDKLREALTEERLAGLLANAHYELVAPILMEQEYRQMAAFILAALDAALHHKDGAS